MKIAIVLVSAAMLLLPSLAAAQNAPTERFERSGHADPAKTPRGSAANPSPGASTSDRAIDAEMKRIDRMMTICTGC